ncbi:glycosyltransferase family 4 protein [Pseudarthrobacter sp. NPDC055928]|uniref:glycosyltransferase family 4 protein n=1 Tax=Pseudarthrobacter sp. NPDC055928 TaxID=3345661 RepID=UPI0035E3072A
MGMLTQWFAPEQFSLPNSLSEQSVLAGDDVRVLTGFPSYPFGKIYDGYSQESSFRENIAGAEVYRVSSFLSHDANAKNRMRTFLSFAVASIRRAHVLADMDVIYVYATPMTASMAAWWLRKWKGVPYVLHIQDLWPESVTSSGMLARGLISSLVGSTLSSVLRPIYSAASHIVVISPSMKEALVGRKVDAGKITTILNWDPSFAEEVSEGGSPSKTTRVRFVYAGNLGVMQDVETILRAAELLRDSPEIEIHIYGSGVLEASLQKFSTDHKLPNVIFHGRVTKAEMYSVYAASEFHLVTLKDDPLFRMTIPSKFQAAMAHGIPVVSTVQGDLEEICAEAGVGWTALPENPVSLAATMRTAAAIDVADRKAMAVRCRDLHRNKFSPDNGIAAVRRILRDVASLNGRNVC